MARRWRSLLSGPGEWSPPAFKSHPLHKLTAPSRRPNRGHCEGGLQLGRGSPIPYSVLSATDTADHNGEAFGSVRPIGSSDTPCATTKDRSMKATFFLMLALAACSTPPAKDRVVEVVKPVAVQPIRPEQVPTLPSPLPPRPESLSAAADVLLGRWCEAVAYMLRADPLLRVSAGQQPGEPPIFPECEGGDR